MGARRLLGLLTVLSPLVAGAIEFRGASRLWLGPGYDTNARRDFVTSNAAPQPDGFLFGLGTVDGVIEGERFRLGATYDVAARKFFFLPSEDTIVNSVAGDFLFALSSAFSIGLAGTVRDRRGAERDYTSLVGQGVIEFAPTANLDVRLRVGATRFLFWPRFAYSFSGPIGDLTARYRFDRRHGVSLTGSFNPRTYNATVNPRPDDTEPSMARRFDPLFVVGAGYSYRGPFHLSLNYSYLDMTSNSYGETLRRHRLSATAGFRLPAKFTLLTTGALQLSLFPDGIFLSPDLQVVEDDENSSTLTVKLVRPVHEHVDLDVRYALYVNVLPQRTTSTEPLLYVRHVFSLGATLSF
ncbi:MAG: hypothetical protein SFW67_00535 [Myxococcaceae bacterium]|nr:hypothetical protein [Myxococcaceae bacterium]